MGGVKVGDESLSEVNIDEMGERENSFENVGNEFGVGSLC